MNSTLPSPVTTSCHVWSRRLFVGTRCSRLRAGPWWVPTTFLSSPSAYMVSALPALPACSPHRCSRLSQCSCLSRLCRDLKGSWQQPRHSARAQCQSEEHSSGSGGLIIHQPASPSSAPQGIQSSQAPCSTAAGSSTNGAKLSSQNGKEPVLNPAQQQLQEEGRQPSTHDSSIATSGSDSEREGGSIHSSRRDSSETGPPIGSSNSLQGLFSLPSVPWGMRKIVQVMVLWLLAYVIIGQVAVPMALCVFGLDRDALGLRGHAVLHLCLDLSQLAVTLAILWGCLKKYKPRSRGLFPMSWRGWWPLVVLAACVVFPAVDWIAQQSLSWFPVEAAESWTNQMETSLSVGDWITNVAYFSVVSICAPIWEEAIFRGFLLTSLGRYMSPQWAVAASSLLFAMCHFRLQTFLPLLVLGVVFSFVFLLTRNLLPPMVLHSVWNVFVLANLLLRPG